MLIMVANSCPNGRTGTGGAGYHEEFGQPAPAGAKPLCPTGHRKNGLLRNHILQINKIPIMVGIPQVLCLSGMNPMTNSRNCTCQQSSVNRRDQRMYESVTAKYVGRHVGVAYACRKYCITIGAGCVLTYSRLSAVRKSDAELRSN